MKPDYLRPRWVWLERHALGVACLVLGVVVFLVVAVQDWAAPDWRIAIPGVGLTVVAAVGSLVRRERAVPLWLGGVGAAVAGLVLGYVVVLAAVVLVTFVLIVILHAVM